MADTIKIHRIMCQHVLDEGHQNCARMDCIGTWRSAVYEDNTCFYCPLRVFTRERKYLGATIHNLEETKDGETLPSNASV